MLVFLVFKEVVAEVDMFIVENLCIEFGLSLFPVQFQFLYFRDRVWPLFRCNSDKFIVFMLSLSSYFRYVFIQNLLGQINAIVIKYQRRDQFLNRLNLQV